MMRFILIVFTLLFLCGCTSEINFKFDVTQSYNADYFSVNEFGVFGMIGEEGIGYYDFQKAKNILIKDLDQMNPSMIQGVCLWENQIYYFENMENARLMKMDLNGKKVQKVYDLSLDDYDYVYTQYSYGYANDKVFFYLGADTWNDNGIDMEQYGQIAMIDLKTNKFTSITEMAKVEPLKSLHLLSYSPDEVIYYIKEMDEQMMSMQDYIHQEGSSLYYHLYAEDHTKITMYRYDINSKETTLLLEDTAMEFEQNCDISDRLIYYRSHDDIYSFHIDTKEKEGVYHDESLYTLDAVLDDTLIFTRSIDNYNEYCSYNIKTEKLNKFSTTHHDGQDALKYFIPTFSVGEYYVGLSGEKMRSVITKEAYYRGNYDSVKSIGW